jgi:hypothetical protein
MVVFTNFIFLVLAVCFFSGLIRHSRQPYARQMAFFILTLGISTGFGAVAHGAHYLLGSLFFDTVFFLSNAFSLFSVYFCFRASYTYYTPVSNKYIIGVVIGWIAVMMAFSLFKGEFLLIKIHAGIVLIYALAVHYLVYRRTHEKGSRIIIIGILISFLSIIVHSFKISLSEWFNYKDIAHAIMIITLSVIYCGVRLNVKALDEKAAMH